MPPLINASVTTGGSLLANTISQLQIALQQTCSQNTEKMTTQKNIYIYINTITFQYFSFKDILEYDISIALF